MLVAVFSALVALAIAGGHDAAAHGNDQHAKTPVVTPRVVAFHDEMRRLWEDHVTWTRLTIISLAGTARHRRQASGGCSRTRLTSATQSSPSTATRPAKS